MAGVVILTIFLGIVVWRKGWQPERGAAMGREIGREVGEAMAHHFGERLGWIEVRVTQLLAVAEQGFTRLGVNVHRVRPRHRLPRERHDALEEQRAAMLPEDEERREPRG